MVQEIFIFQTREVKKREHSTNRLCVREKLHKCNEGQMVSVVGVGYGNVVTMWPQYEYRSFTFISQQKKVYIAKQLQHLDG